MEDNRKRSALFIKLLKKLNRLYADKKVIRIEQRQQHGDEKSLNNGAIFMKFYLVE